MAATWHKTSCSEDKIVLNEDPLEARNTSKYKNSRLVFIEYIHVQ